MKENIIRIINANRIFAIVRGAEADKMAELAKALYKGGIRAMELTLDQKNADVRERTLETVALLSEKMVGKMAIGTGTVMSAEQVEQSADAGAQFVVSPSTDAGVIAKAKELSLAAIPGAYTPSEIVAAYNAGADFVKLFPADEMGLSYIKSISAPLSHVPMMAVGNVNADTLGAYMDAGCFGAGVGSALVNKKWMAEGRFDLITEYAERLVKLVNEHKQFK